MTADHPATDPRILRALVGMAIAKRAELDDLTQQVYVAGLEDMAPEWVIRACERLGRQPRAPFEPALPTLGTLRQVAAEIGREDRAAADKAKLLPSPAGADDDPRSWVCCRDCEDTGWRSFRCHGDHAPAVTGEPRDPHLESRFCGRARQHARHGWADRCACIATNPVIARRHEATRSSAA
jgi:hypothetical protein